MPTTEAPGVAALQTILRLDTVASHDAATTDEGPFLELHRLLRAHFPLTHDIGEVLHVPPHGLLVRVPAAADSATADADPVVLMAHMDIVPIGEATRWTHDPLGGDVVDGVIWGRGTLDDKGQLVAAITAVESLLADGLRPARDVWLSFGSDEEVMGTGAQNAVQVLRRRGVSPWFVLDEGGAVASGAFPGVTRPLGVVGVSEKGVLSLRLTASGRGGHASRPAKGGPPPAWPRPSTAWSDALSPPTCRRRRWRCSAGSGRTCPAPCDRCSTGPSGSPVPWPGSWSPPARRQRPWRAPRSP